LTVLLGLEVAGMNAELVQGLQKKKVGESAPNLSTTLESFDCTTPDFISDILLGRSISFACWTVIGWPGVVLPGWVVSLSFEAEALFHL
jgi:hypothetical protein